MQCCAQSGGVKTAQEKNHINRRARARARELERASGHNPQAMSNVLSRKDDFGRHTNTIARTSRSTPSRHKNRAIKLHLSRTKLIFISFVLFTVYGYIVAKLALRGYPNAETEHLPTAPVLRPSSSSSLGGATNTTLLDPALVLGSSTSPHDKPISSNRKASSRKRATTTLHSMITTARTTATTPSTTTTANTTTTTTTSTRTSSTTSTTGVKEGLQQLQHQQRQQRQPKHRHHHEDEPRVVAFATSITGCGVEPYTEGAAVLKHAVHLSSVHGDRGGRYDYHMYAIYHPNATACALPLAALGYTLLRRDTPVNVSDIRGDDLREGIGRSGCCGEKELIKLEAYTLTQHPIVVHLDLDVLLLKPMDDVFDLMLAQGRTEHEGEGTNSLASSVPVMWPDVPLPDPINIFWTKDYGMVPPKRKDKPTQGGLLILRPNRTVYDDLVSIVQEGNFHRRRGWGSKIGPFYGGMTIQGLIPYYYEYLHPGQGVELNRCIHNNMNDNPKMNETINDVPQGECRTGQDRCEDCRARRFEDVVSFHFTNCLKPWHCQPHKQDKVQMRLCRRMTHEWYQVRSHLEQSWGRTGFGDGKFDHEHFFGNCNEKGPGGYRVIAYPYGAGQLAVA